MRKPAVDYRTFRLVKINEPQFSHLKLLLSWAGYFVFFVLTEKLIPADLCYPVHCKLDDLIPFNEFFFIPYVFWYVLIVISLVYFLLYNVEGFKDLQKFIIITQVVAIAAYMLFPSRQDLRPLVFPRDNFLTRCVAFLYSIDTNTGVCPSLHVAFSLGIASVWLKEKSASVGWKIFVVTAVILICLSTMFIKQHSAVDFLAALPMCLLAEWMLFGKKYWMPRLKSD